MSSPNIYPDVIHVIDRQEGGGVLLRLVSDEQIDPYLPPTSAALRHLPQGAAQNASSLREDIAGRNGAMWGIYPIIENTPTVEPIGVVAVMPDEVPEIAITSTVLFDPEAHHGRGYGTAAKVGAMTVGYAAGVELFCAEIAGSNEASMRSATKVGYVQWPPDLMTEDSMKPTGPDGEVDAWREWQAFSPNVEHWAPTAVVDKSQEAFFAARVRYDVEFERGGPNQEANPATPAE
jgi:RimJ/RimL family protein N-acetyltransferase